MPQQVSRLAREPASLALDRPAAGATDAAATFAEAKVAVAPHIVIVGGGAGGLVLASRLGDRLGRRGRARITLVDCALSHVWKPLLHEVAAGTLRADADGLDYFAHARAHHYAFELGRMSGLDRAPQGDRARPGAGCQRRRDHRAAAPRLRHAGDRGRQRDQRLRRAGGRRALPVPRQPGRGRAHPSAGVRPLPARPFRGRDRRAPQPALRDRRRGRHRGRARGRAAPCRAPAHGLRPARLRPRPGRRDPADRGGARGAAGAARAAPGRDRGAAAGARDRGAHQRAGRRWSLPTACTRGRAS